MSSTLVQMVWLQFLIVSMMVLKQNYDSLLLEGALSAHDLPGAVLGPHEGTDDGSEGDGDEDGKHGIAPSPVGQDALGDLGRDKVVDDEWGADETRDETTPSERGHVGDDDLLEHLQAGVAKGLIVSWTVAESEARTTHVQDLSSGDLVDVVGGGNDDVADDVEDGDDDEGLTTADPFHQLWSRASRGDLHIGQLGHERLADGNDDGLGGGDGTGERVLEDTRGAGRGSAINHVAAGINIRVGEVLPGGDTVKRVDVRRQRDTDEEEPSTLHAPVV